MLNWKTLIFILKLCISLSLLAYLVWLIDWERAVRILIRTAKLPIFLVPSITMIGCWFASLRWRLILAGNNIKFSGWHAFRGYLLGLFYGFFLPGVLSGDVVRIALCIKRTNSPIGTATATVLLERVSGILALLSITFIVYSIFPEISSALLAIEDTRLLGMLSVSGILGIAVLLLSRHL